MRCPDATTNLRSIGLHFAAITLAACSERSADQPDKVYTAGMASSLWPAEDSFTARFMEEFFACRTP
jgi:hypothetical protein